MRLITDRLSLRVQLALVLLATTLGLHLMMIAIDRVAEADRGRQRFRDLAPMHFHAALPRVLGASEELRPTVLRLIGDPAHHWSFGPRPELFESDETDPAYAARTLAWARRVGLPVDAVIVAGRSAPPSRYRGDTPPGVAMERSPLLALGEAPRTALFERPMRTPNWVREEARPDGPPPTAGVRVYTIAMRIEGTGDWLALRALSRPPPVNASITKLLATVLGTLAVTGAGLLVGRRLMRPLGRLSEAAESIGRGERAEAIPLEGPSDLREIVRGFNRMGERVTQSVDYQLGLLRSLGHDLKGPMAAMRSMLASVGPDTTREQIERRLERMNAIVGAIMSFSRATMRDGAIEETDLAALVEAVVEERAEQGDDTLFEGVEGKEPGEPLYVRLRFNAVERMLANVVANAVKYGGSARARIAIEGDEAVIRVDDDGPGVPPSEIEAVFQPFRRLATDGEGTGLGLAIVRTIAVDHGGSVRLYNRPEGGLTVEIRLPL